MQADVAAAGEELPSVKTDYISENIFPFMYEICIHKVLLLCETLAREISLTGRQLPPTLFKAYQHFLV